MRKALDVAKPKPKPKSNVCKKCGEADDNLYPIWGACPHKEAK